MMQTIDAKKPWFSFMYGGKPFCEMIDRARIEEQVGEDAGEVIHKVTYHLPDGLKVIWRVRVFEQFEACHWALRFANEGTADTKQISDVNDCDFTARFQAVPHAPSGYRPHKDAVRVFKTTGSNWERCEFHSTADALINGGELKYACTGGRSSQGLAPFFDITQQGAGLLLAIGWTGQWNAAFRADAGAVCLKAGVEALNFHLHPGEEVRTASILLMKYDGGQNAGHNAFRRLIRKHFSLIGQPGRPSEGPLCTGSWGAVPSEKMCERMKRIQEAGLGMEYYWIDAGWYGHSTHLCKNEFEGDWARNTGSWNVNPLQHPDDFNDVARAVPENGMQMLLWIEPERVIRGTDSPNEHPEWYIDMGGDALLLNLAREDALEGTIEMVSEKIERLKLGCYRQDFNVNPLDYWRAADEEGRAGLTELKHIENLYRFWDALLARFPHLIIDNCASGGRRIDIETLSRSIPLWRSDYQCTFDADPETTQVHNTGISWWIPYSGTGMGQVMGDTYRARSCYSSALTQFFWWMYDNDVEDNENLRWAKDIFEEYRSVRPYFACDYYPLTYNAVDDTTWCGWQYDRPEEGDGIVLLFRRPESPMTEAVLKLNFPADNRIYAFRDADSGETFRVSGREATRGVTFRIGEARTSRLLRYHLVK